MALKGAKSGSVRYMWLMVFFDLPVDSKKSRRFATRFRNFLKDDGYTMMQYSVYSRPLRGEDAVQKHLDRLVKSLPPNGSVRALPVTNRQYSRMRILVGEQKKNEEIGAEQLVLL